MDGVGEEFLIPLFGFENIHAWKMLCLKKKFSPFSAFTPTNYNSKYIFAWRLSWMMVMIMGSIEERSLTSSALLG